jgi:hypothetical protein
VERHAATAGRGQEQLQLKLGNNYS